MCTQYPWYPQCYHFLLYCKYILVPGIYVFHFNKLQILFIVNFFLVSTHCLFHVRNVWWWPPFLFFIFENILCVYCRSFRFIGVDKFKMCYKLRPGYVTKSFCTSSFPLYGSLWTQFSCVLDLGHQKTSSITSTSLSTPLVNITACGCILQSLMYRVLDLTQVE